MPKLRVFGVYHSNRHVSDCSADRKMLAFEMSDFRAVCLASFRSSPGRK